MQRGPQWRNYNLGLIRKKHYRVKKIMQIFEIGKCMGKERQDGRLHFRLFSHDETQFKKHAHCISLPVRKNSPMAY